MLQMKENVTMTMILVVKMVISCCNINFVSDGSGGGGGDGYIKSIGISNKKFIDFKLLTPSFLKIPLV